MSVKIISMSKITRNWTVRIPQVVVELLKSDEGTKATYVDWIIDNDRLLLKRRDESNNNIISYGTIRNYGEMSELSTPRDIRELLGLGMGDDILWIIDEDLNIIVKDVILPKNCITKDKSILMNMSFISSSLTRIPKDIRDHLKVNIGDRIAFLYNDDNIVVKKYDEAIVQPSIIAHTKIQNNMEVYIIGLIIDLLDLEDLILWILDNDGNIIIKGAILPDICADVVHE